MNGDVSRVTGPWYIEIFDTRPARLFVSFRYTFPHTHR